MSETAPRGVNEVFLLAALWTGWFALFLWSERDPSWAERAKDAGLYALVPAFGAALARLPFGRARTPQAAWGAGGGGALAYLLLAWPNLGRGYDAGDLALGVGAVFAAGLAVTVALQTLSPRSRAKVGREHRVPAHADGVRRRRA